MLCKPPRLAAAPMFRPLAYLAELASPRPSLPLDTSENIDAELLASPFEKILEFVDAISAKTDLTTDFKSHLQTRFDLLTQLEEIVAHRTALLAQPDLPA